VRVTLLHHPDAGDDDQPDAKALEQLLKRHGYAVRYQSADEELWSAVLACFTDASVLDRLHKYCQQYAAEPANAGLPARTALAACWTSSSPTT